MPENRQTPPDTGDRPVEPTGKQEEKKNAEEAPEPCLLNRRALFIGGTLLGAIAACGGLQLIGTAAPSGCVAAPFVGAPAGDQGYLVVTVSAPAGAPEATFAVSAEHDGEAVAMTSGRRGVVDAMTSGRRGVVDAGTYSLIPANGAMLLSDGSVLLGFATLI